MTDFDVIIIGAGSIGVPAAYFLAREGKKVLCLDPNSASGQGQNKAAIGGARATHSDPAKIMICQESLGIFSSWEAETGDAIGWKKGGYCFPVYGEAVENSLKSILLGNPRKRSLFWICCTDNQPLPRFPLHSGFDRPSRPGPAPTPGSGPQQTHGTSGTIHWFLCTGRSSQSLRFLSSEWYFYDPPPNRSSCPQNPHLISDRKIPAFPAEACIPHPRSLKNRSIRSLNRKNKSPGIESQTQRYLPFPRIVPHPWCEMCRLPNQSAILCRDSQKKYPE